MPQLRRVAPVHLKGTAKCHFVSELIPLLFFFNQMNIIFDFYKKYNQYLFSDKYKNVVWLGFRCILLILQQYYRTTNYEESNSYSYQLYRWAIHQRSSPIVYG